MGKELYEKYKPVITTIARINDFLENENPVSYGPEAVMGNQPVKPLCAPERFCSILHSGLIKFSADLGDLMDPLFYTTEMKDAVSSLEGYLDEYDKILEPVRQKYEALHGAGCFQPRFCSKEPDYPVFNHIVPLTGQMAEFLSPEDAALIQVAADQMDDFDVRLSVFLKEKFRPAFEQAETITLRGYDQLIERFANESLPNRRQPGGVAVNVWFFAMQQASRGFLNELKRPKEYSQFLFESLGGNAARITSTTVSYTRKIKEFQNFTILSTYQNNVERIKQRIVQRYDTFDNLMEITDNFRKKPVNPFRVERYKDMIADLGLNERERFERVKNRPARRSDPQKPSSGGGGCPFHPPSQSGPTL